jgi:hypothetical protein
MSRPHSVYPFIHWRQRVVSIFWQLCIQLLWALVYKYLFESLFLFLSGKSLRVEWLDHMFNNFSVFFSSYTFYLPPSKMQAFQSFYILSTLTVFQFEELIFYDSHPKGHVSSHCSLTFKFPVSQGGQHLFSGFLAVFGERSAQSFACFWVQLLAESQSSLYVSVCSLHKGVLFSLCYFHMYV